MSSGDATEILSCVILVLPIYGSDHVDDGDTRRILVSLPNIPNLRDPWPWHLLLVCLVARDL